MLAVAAQAGAQVNDFQIWSGYNFHKKLFKGTNLNVELENRYDQNAMLRKSSHFHMEISHRISKGIRFSAAYRFSRIRDSYKIYDSKNRFDLNLRFKKEINRVTYSYRTRYQSSYRSFYTSESGRIPANVWRNKFGLEINLKKKFKKLTPGFSVELISQLNGSNGTFIRAVRRKIKADYRIKKRKYLNFFLHDRIGKKYLKSNQGLRFRSRVFLLFPQQEKEKQGLKGGEIIEQSDSDGRVRYM